MRAALLLAVSVSCFVATHSVSKLRGVTPPPLGWSAPGHEITGAIASAFLTASATNKVNSILQPGETLESVGPWADTVRDNPAFSKWSPPLHFINTPDWQCAFTPNTDCVGLTCVYGAILNYTGRCTNQTGEQQYEALKFLDHFLGDIHQPLHVSFASNLGGNTITGKYFGTSTNLHHVWDYSIINSRITNDFSGDQEAYTSYLVQQLKGPWKSNATLWTKCVTPGSSQCVVDWATESAGLACTYSYKDQTGAIVQKGFEFEQPYYDFTIGVVEMQLSKGGLRLAGLLNNLWASEEEKANGAVLVEFS